MFHPVRPLFDYADAARIYRTCRGRGFTPRAMADCLVAAIAIDRGCAVLHHDRDFDRIAACTGLVVAG
jgi:predicted nucleic acid-binding protein